MPSYRKRRFNRRFGKKRFGGYKKRRTFRRRKRRNILAGPRGPESKLKSYLQSVPTALQGMALPLDLNGGFSVTRGTDVHQRVGNRIIITSIYGRAIFRLTAPATTNVIRLLIIVDRQANAELGLTPAQYFQNSTVPVYSSLDVNAKPRYKTLYDRTVLLSAVAATNAFMKWSIRCKIPVQFEDSNVGDYADVSTNNLYMYCWSDGNVGQYPTMTWESNYRFRDV